MENEKRAVKNCFREGAVSPVYIGESIAAHQRKTTIGAHQLFLGQVRADVIDGKEVTGIEYSAHEDMANHVFDEIREEAFRRFSPVCLHIYHSLGWVKSGEICLFVFVSSAHRKAAGECLGFVVEAIKERVPVFGKEIFADNSHVWKVNT